MSAQARRGLAARLRRSARPARRARQRGVAAIEFAGLFMTLFLVLYGIVSFGAVLYVHQTVARAAEEGARTVALLPPGAAVQEQRIRDAVYDSLAGSLVAPLDAGQTTAARRAWIVAHVTVAITAAAGSALTVGVSYDYSANRVLPSLALLDTARWLPDTLTSRATAVKPT